MANPLEASLMGHNNVQHAGKNDRDVEQEFWKFVAAQIIIVSLTVLSPLTTLYWPTSAIFAGTAFTVVEGLYFFWLYTKDAEPPPDEPMIQLSPPRPLSTASSVASDLGQLKIDPEDRAALVGEDGDGGGGDGTVTVVSDGDDSDSNCGESVLIEDPDAVQ